MKLYQIVPIVIPAAIQSHHSVQYYDVPSTGYIQPTTIEVGANSVPLNILFRSASSHLNVQQYHEGARGDSQVCHFIVIYHKNKSKTNVSFLQETYSQDEPHYLKHTVKKPIYQEVNHSNILTSSL